MQCKEQPLERKGRQEPLILYSRAARPLYRFCIILLQRVGYSSLKLRARFQHR